MPVVFLASGRAIGGTIVPYLSDSQAGQTLTASTGTSSVGAGSVTAANGLTLAVRVTPSSTDVANSTWTNNATSSSTTYGPVNLIEIGGTTNGSGIYMLNGQYWFIAHSGAFPYTTNSMSTPAGNAGNTNDTDGASISVVIGTPTGGQDTLYVTFDSVGSRLIFGENGSQTTETLTNTSGASFNFYGNGTISFAGQDTTSGNRGGLDGGGDAFSSLAGQAYVGANGSTVFGQYFNAVPEPSSMTLIGVVGAMLTARRRRVRTAGR